MLDCVSIGSATQDVFVFSEGAQIHRLQSLDREDAFLAFEYGAKVMVEQLFVTIGGGAVNTSIAMSKLGLQTGIVCELGQDAAGDTIVQGLAAAGVDTGMIARNVAVHTGYSVIITGFDGDRTVLVHRGAARDLAQSEVPWEKLAEARWVFLGSMAGGSASLWNDVADFALQNGLKLAINPGSEQFKRGLQGLSPVLHATEIIFVNRTEAFKLVGLEYTRGDDDDREVMRRLHGAGCRLVVMTLGKEGAWGFDGRDFHFCPAAAVKVVSNLGAGDAFGSACLAALHRGLDLPQALCAGSANAGGVVSTMGATEGLLSWEQVSAALA